jgi:hypothetical protein
MSWFLPNFNNKALSYNYPWACLFVDMFRLLSENAKENAKLCSIVASSYISCIPASKEAELLLFHVLISI